MSDMEHNKGKLIPVALDNKYLGLEPEELEDVLYELGLVMIDHQAYSVEWEIQRGELYDFAYVDTNEDGSINFNTYHYNGGGHWTEVVEEALNND